jgi:NitT/TauT family transport system permease protein
VIVRLLSLALLLAAWYAGAEIAGPRLLPDPQAVALAIYHEAVTPGWDLRIPVIDSVIHIGALWFNLGATLARVVISFSIAMAIGTAAGLVMGRYPFADRLGDPWLVVLLNLPALVIIVLAYVWAGWDPGCGCGMWCCRSLPPILRRQPAPGYRWCGRSCSLSNCSGVRTVSGSRLGLRFNCST